MLEKKMNGIFSKNGSLDSVAGENRFSFKGEPELFTRILVDMRENAGRLAPIPHWDIGYSREQEGVAIDNAEAYKKSCETMESMLAPWVGCLGMLPVGSEEWSRYKEFFKTHDHLELLPKEANEEKLRELGWISTDLGSVMDINFLHAFSNPPLGEKGTSYILEVGGGYGRLAEAVLNVFEGRVKYVLLDAVPASLMYAYLYLSRRCPERKIGFYYNEDPFDMNRFDCYVMPSWHFERLKRHKFDVAVNIESMQEMGQEHVDHYLNLFDRTVRGGGCIYLSNAHDYVFKGTWNYPASWRRLYLSNTPRSWSPDHPTEVFLKISKIKIFFGVCRDFLYRLIRN